MVVVVFVVVVVVVVVGVGNRVWVLLKIDLLFEVEAGFGVGEFDFEVFRGQLGGGVEAEVVVGPEGLKVNFKVGEEVEGGDSSLDVDVEVEVEVGSDVVLVLFVVVGWDNDRFFLFTNTSIVTTLSIACLGF